MRFFIGIEEAAEDHRAAVAAAVRVVEAQDPAAWSLKRAPGKWSPSEIAQHLVISYGPPLAELDGGPGFAVRLPWWQRAALRWTVVPRILGGTFPKGAPAPRESRPAAGAASPAHAAQALREAADLFERRLLEEHAVRRVTLTHAYFGRLSAPQMLKLAAVHVSHHRAQFPLGPAAR